MCSSITLARAARPDVRKRRLHRLMTVRNVIRLVNLCWQEDVAPTTTSTRRKRTRTPLAPKVKETQELQGSSADCLGTEPRDCSRT